MGIFSPPEKIDPAKIYSMMTSDYTTQMGDRANQMADPNSALMQGIYQNMQQQGQDNLYTQNRLQTQGSFRNNMSGQSGINDAIQNQNVGAMGNQNVQNFANLQQGSLNQSNQLLNTAAQNDMTARSSSASAYGQNITNQNNYDSAMTSNAMQLGGMMLLSDPRVKRNMKKIGHVKTIKKPLSLYSFSYKGSKGKKMTGFSTTDVKKQFPGAVKKDSGGLEWIDLDGLRQVLKT